MLGKNVQYQTRTIEELGVVSHSFLQIAQLPGRQLLVKNDHVAVQIRAEVKNFLDFARTDQGRRVETLQALPRLPDNLKASRLRKLCEFDQRVLNVPAPLLPLQLCAHEQCLFHRHLGLNHTSSDDAPLSTPMHAPHSFQASGRIAPSS